MVAGLAHLDTIPELVEKYRDVSMIELCEIFKPKQMSEKTNEVQESAAGALLNRLNNLEDLAYANRNVSRNIKVGVFGSEPEGNDKPEGKTDPGCWFDLVNHKIDLIVEASREAERNLDRIQNGMIF